MRTAALNFTTGLGLGLAIDYGLFMVSRYREESAKQGFGAEALTRTLQTAGRTVLFSSLTIARLDDGLIRRMDVEEPEQCRRSHLVAAFVILRVRAPANSLALRSCAIVPRAAAAEIEDECAWPTEYRWVITRPRRPVHRMPGSGATPMRARLNNYTAHSIGCGAVWAAILLVAQRLADSEARKAMQLWCAAWWSGWSSATIARVGYPPPKKLGPRAEKALQVTSVPMIALGVGSAIPFLWAARKRP